MGQLPNRHLAIRWWLEFEAVVSVEEVVKSDRCRLQSRTITSFESVTLRANCCLEISATSSRKLITEMCTCGLLCGQQLSSACLARIEAGPVLLYFTSYSVEKKFGAIVDSKIDTDASMNPQGQ